MDKGVLKLDERDKKILSELEQNSRISFKEIGKKAGLSGETVEYRVMRWRKKGFIKHLFIDPNLPKIGLKTYRLYLKVEGLPVDIEQKLTSEFSTKPTVQWFAITQGNWDYIIRFVLKTEIEFRKEVETTLVNYGKYIKDKDIAITTSQDYFPMTYYFDTPRERTHKDEESQIAALDGTDFEILSHLFEDSRTPTTKIAKSIGISPDTIQYRIKKMTKEGVLDKFTCLFDQTQIGYSSYKVLFWFQYITPEDEKEFVQYCENHPQVIFINRVISGWDIEVDFHAKNPEELQKILKTIRNKFSKIIRNYSILTVLTEFIPNTFKNKNIEPSK